MLEGWTVGLEAWIWLGAWALVLLLVVWLLVREPSHDIHEDARAILRARYARGEISEEEFKHATDTLTTDPVNGPRPIGARPHTADHATHGQEARHD